MSDGEGKERLKFPGLPMCQVACSRGFALSCVYGLIGDTFSFYREGTSHMFMTLWATQFHFHFIGRNQNMTELSNVLNAAVSAARFSPPP